MPSSSKMLGWLSKMRLIFLMLVTSPSSRKLLKACKRSTKACPRYAGRLASSRPHPHLGNSREITGDAAPDELITQLFSPVLSLVNNKMRMISPHIRIYLFYFPFVLIARWFDKLGRLGRAQLHSRLESQSATRSRFVRKVNFQQNESKSS